MKLQRLAKMQPAELAFRLRQQVHKTMGRMVASRPETEPLLKLDLKRFADASETNALLSSATPFAHPAPAELQKTLQQRIPKRFFAGVSDIAKAYGTPQGVNPLENKPLLQLTAAADAVSQGKFDILGYGRLSFGEPICWQLDPISGRVSPSLHWSLIKPLDAEQVGDCKVVWELNRHQWLLELGQAYCVTHEDCYANSFAAYIKDWMLANPPGWGINWASALEVSMRLISWCWALRLFNDAKALTPDLFETMLAWIQRHALFVEQNLSRYFSPNTHLTVEALGLFYVGTLFPELEGAQRWQAIGQQILIEQLPLQVHADGVYFEQSTRYQYYTAEVYLHYVVLAQTNGLSVPDEVNSRIEKLMEFLLQLQRPDGSLPQIGDTDGGWLLPLIRRTPGDFRGLFSNAAAIFQNRQFAWAAGGQTEEALILQGKAAVESSALMAPEQPPSTALHCFRQGGYIIMRNGWDKQSHQLIFDTGPLGCHVSGGHGHADLLAIQCCAFGETFITDSGTGCYSSDLKWRNYFRSSRAHSTVMIDGRDQARPNGPFSWHAHPSAQLRLCAETPDYLSAEAQHGAYADLPDPVTHRRRVIMSNAGYWIVVDDLFGGDIHDVQLRYQFAPLIVSQENNNWVRARGATSSLWLKVCSVTSLTQHIENGELDPVGGWHSPNYGQRFPAPALVCSSRTRLPARLVTIIYPDKSLSASPPDLQLQVPLYFDISAYPSESESCAV